MGPTWRSATRRSSRNAGKSSSDRQVLTAKRPPLRSARRIWPTAVSQMRRALRSGGRLAVSTWRSDEDFPALRELRRVAERHVGPISDRRHGFGDADMLAALFR